MAKKKVWVVGHKHPDTDSICAAISYANLKNEIEKKNPKTATGMTYIAKRAGSVNSGDGVCSGKVSMQRPRQ